MSFGSYLTGQNEKKKDEVVTAPAVGTGTASQNHQAGVSYANWLRDSAYKSAEAATAESNRLAQKQYERTVIDSQSSYQKAIGAYGSNAETVASRGLAGSGYGEWLQGNAYSTHRGEVQSAGAQRLATQKEAAYKEGQAKQTADMSYGQFLYQNDVNLNNERNSAYTSLYNSAATGASIESIMQDGRWGDLTPKQQEAITNKANAYANDKATAEAEDKVNASYSTALDLLGKGWTLDEIQKYIGADSWAALGDKVGQLTAANEAYNRIKSDAESKAGKESIAGYLDLAATGAYTIEALEAVAKSMGHYDALNTPDAEGKTPWSHVTDVYNRTNNTSTVQDMIDNGASADEIKGSDAYAGLTPGDKASADSLITERDVQNKIKEEERQAKIDADVEILVTSVDDKGNPVYATLADVESHLTSLEYTASEKKEIISAWQKKNADDLSDLLESAKLDNTDFPRVNGVAFDTFEFVNDIKNGIYGNNTAEVIDEYCNVFIKFAQTSYSSANDAYSELYYLGKHLAKIGVDTGAVDDALSKIMQYINSGTTNKSNLR